MNPISAYVAGELFDRFFAYFFSWTFRSSLALFRFLGWLKMNDDIEKAPGLRGKVLWQEAQRRGIPMQSLIFCGKYIDGYEVRVGEKKINFAGLPRLPQGSSQWWIDDKAELKKMLQKAGVPVPRGGSFTRFKPLLARFRTLEKPVIIKPRLGSRGRHTTTNISTEEDLKKAYDCAKQLCHWVVMEEHLVGSVYRGTVIDGALVGVLRGDPPRITGDGVKTIAQLVDSKNEHRPKQVSPVVLTSAHEEFLRRMGYTFTSVLPAGLTIDILEKIGISYGGYSVEVTAKTHPETKRYLSLAGQVINDPIAGFDFIIQDIEKSPDEQKWGIIECNGLPFINLHHFPVEGEPVNVASAVWDFVEKNIDKY
jgi:cyanophycin synthetase